MKEEWREIFDGHYEVSSLGRVRRSRPGRRTFAGRLLTPILLRAGYFAVRPVVNGKNVQRYVHELVAGAFLGPRPTGREVNHIDGVKTNNAVGNLEYVTHAGNMAHAAAARLMMSGGRHPGAKLTDQQVRDIRAAHGRGVRNRELARSFGVAPSTITQITKGQRRVA